MKTKYASTHEFNQELSWFMKEKSSYVPDIEDIVGLGQKNKTCPYFMCLERLVGSRMVLVCNHKYLYGNISV